jgi:hypothetical protein
MEDRMPQESPSTLNYAGLSARFSWKSWMWLVVSLIPISVVVIYNAHAGEMLGLQLQKISIPLQAFLSPGLAIAATFGLYLCVPLSLGFTLSWVSWRSFRREISAAARVGKFLAWSVMMLHGAILITVIGVAILVHFI